MVSSAAPISIFARFTELVYVRLQDDFILAASNRRHRIRREGNVVGVGCYLSPSLFHAVTESIGNSNSVTRAAVHSR
jgi:hypothetical protein